MMTLSEQQGNPDDIYPDTMNYPMFSRYMGRFLWLYYGNPELCAWSN